MSRLNSAVRSVIRSRWVQGAALSSGVAEEFASAYVVPAEADAISVARKLKKQGLEISLAYLPTSDDESESPGRILETLEHLGDLARGAELSVKPSSLGLRDDRVAAAAVLDGLCRAADDAGALITLEMQGAGEYQPTLDLWQQARSDHPLLGITLPADIRRAERDVATAAGDGARVRLCVGSYPVPPSMGYRRERDKQLALVRCLRVAMESGAYPMLASHDPTLIAIAQDLARRNAIPRDGFEFQMFYGVRPLEQRRLTDIGFTSRTYVPFGPGWFEYLTTRIAARPRTAFSYLRAVADKS
ncbi:hypothetical protein [Tessaracoccus sp. MC1756]|uniref:hypothetical protein n=1 Tax=Tessaracoccus sp. MC1756 TaxID=2760311 RepID=UPI001603C115|nr:hypothetical protein [Tessaracoccus sp. MC1756]MBB1508494.1 hypothetical protein [Tessaracoccus sp. MC1756]